MKPIFNQHIGIFENALSDSLCDKIIHHFNSPQSIKRDRRKNQYNPEVNKSPDREDRDIVDDTFTTLFEPDIEDKNSKSLREEVNKSLFQCWEKYSHQYMLHNYDKAGAGIYISDYKIQKTLPTQGFHHWHCEQTNSGPYRYAVYSIYLNDSFEGGETEFLYQSLRIVPKKGTVAIFPTFYTHIHRGNPPLSGEKYLLTGWFNYAYKDGENIDIQEIHSPPNLALFEKEQLFIYYLENK